MPRGRPKNPNPKPRNRDSWDIWEVEPNEARRRARLAGHKPKKIRKRRKGRGFEKGKHRRDYKILWRGDEKGVAHAFHRIGLGWWGSLCGHEARTHEEMGDMAVIACPVEDLRCRCCEQRTKDVLFVRKVNPSTY